MQDPSQQCRGRSRRPGRRVRICVPLRVRQAAAPPSPRRRRRRHRPAGTSSRRQITGMTGETCAIAAKRLKNCVLRPEHHRRAQDGRRPGNAARTACSPLRLAFGIEAGAGRVGADRREVHQRAAPRPRRRAGRRGPRPRPARARSRRRRRSARMPTRLTTMSAPSTARATAAVVLDVGEQRHDLPDRAHRLEEQRRFRVAHRHAHDVAGRGQPLDHVAADEPRTAEHRRHAARRHAGLPEGCCWWLICAQAAALKRSYRWQPADGGWSVPTGAAARKVSPSRGAGCAGGDADCRRRLVQNQPRRGCAPASRRAPARASLRALQQVVDGLTEHR